MTGGRSPAFSELAKGLWPSSQDGAVAQDGRLRRSGHQAEKYFFRLEIASRIANCLFDDHRR